MGKQHEMAALLDVCLLVGGDAKSIRLPLHREGFKEIRQYVGRYRKSEGKLWAIVLAALAAIRALHEATGQRIMIDHFGDPRPN